MITAGVLHGLSVGDLWEAFTPFQGIDPNEKVIFEVVEIDASAGKIMIRGSYFGIRIGEWRGSVSGKSLKWERL